MINTIEKITKSNPDSDKGFVPASLSKQSNRVIARARLSTSDRITFKIFNKIFLPQDQFPSCMKKQSVLNNQFQWILKSYCKYFYCKDFHDRSFQPRVILNDNLNVKIYFHNQRRIRLSLQKQTQTLMNFLFSIVRSRSYPCPFNKKSFKQTNTKRLYL